MSYIEVRPARPEDREIVLAFCANTWEWGDYIEYVWEEWLTNTNGLLLVATVEGRPAGIAHMQMLTATDAWLEGLRVDPQYRHQGLAKALNEGLLLEAMRRGATYARLAIESNNTRSIQITERGHWRRVGAFTLFSTIPQTKPQQWSPREKPRLATLDDLDAIIDFLNASNIFPLVGGLYHIRYKAYPITAELLEEKIRAQQVSVLYRWERLDGLAITEPREDREGNQILSVGYIDGTAIEPISLIAHNLRLSAMEMGRIEVFAPDLVLVRDAFTGVGYEWNEMVFYTYERGLT